jgi:hypothetical protein
MIADLIIDQYFDFIFKQTSYSNEHHIQTNIIFKQTSYSNKHHIQTNIIFKQTSYSNKHHIQIISYWHYNYTRNETILCTRPSLSVKPYRL